MSPSIITPRYQWGSVVTPESRGHVLKWTSKNVIRINFHVSGAEEWSGHPSEIQVLERTSSAKEKKQEDIEIEAVVVGSNYRVPKVTFNSI